MIATVGGRWADGHHWEVVLVWGGACSTYLSATIYSFGRFKQRLVGFVAN